MPGFIKAIADKIATLTAANFPGSARPAVFFTEAPLTKSDATAQPLPYVVLEHLGTSNETDFEGNCAATGRFQIHVYYAQLADVDTAVNALRFNGSAPSARAGLDMTDTLIVSGWTYEAGSLRHEEETQAQERERGPSAGYVHRSTLTYTVSAYKTS